jgi:hypothetical protein
VNLYAPIPRDRLETAEIAMVLAVHPDVLPALVGASRQRRSEPSLEALSAWVRQKLSRAARRFTVSEPGAAVSASTATPANDNAETILSAIAALAPDPFDFKRWLSSLPAADRDLLHAPLSAAPTRALQLLESAKRQFGPDDPSTASVNSC